MAEMLSPGVYVTEIDASTIAPSVSNSVCVFAGKFDKGPVDAFTLITTVDELVAFYGLPGDDNYNDWYQAYNFLQYGNKLYVARAANVNGSLEVVNGLALATNVVADSTDTVDLLDGSLVGSGDVLNFGGENYLVKSISSNAVTLDRIVSEELVAADTTVSVVSISMNGVFEPVVEGAAEVSEVELFGKNIAILNAADFEAKEVSVAMASADAKLKVIARNPGDWAEDLEIAIAKPADFGTGAQAFDGIALDDLFEYFPSGSEVGVMIRLDGIIQEIFTVDFDPAAKDANGKSTYIENVINNQSKLIFVKDNTAQPADVKSYIFSADGTFGLVGGKSSAIQADDIANAYELWANKEEVDIDIVIANETDGGAAAHNLVEARKDCIGFMGAEYGSVVGKKASDAVAGLIEWRKTGNANFNSMFMVACGNYKYQYDRYNDKNRWVSIAGDIAGLRAATSASRASWWASAGLERGQIKNVKKLAFNPNQAHRDLLYKNAINPIVAFPGQGTVMWGQKTLLAKPSSFDRVNVRGLFNTVERSLSKMAKYQVMEFNDNFTRNRIVSMIKPFLSSVQAGRGIQDFLVICDTSNNTPDVISRNQLVVDIYIKPTYVAEFVHLKFTNAGTNSFAEVIGG